MIREVIGNGFVVHRRRRSPGLQQGLDFRREVERPVISQHVVQGFYPQAIARKEELFFTTVPDGKRKHPAELVDRPRTFFLVEAENGLGVAPSAVTVAASLKRGSEIPVVINLARVHYVQIA